MTTDHTQPYGTFKIEVKKKRSVFQKFTTPNLYTLPLFGIEHTTYPCSLSTICTKSRNTGVWTIWFEMCTDSAIPRSQNANLLFSQLFFHSSRGMPFLSGSFRRKLMLSVSTLPCPGMEPDIPHTEIIVLLRDSNPRPSVC